MDISCFEFRVLKTYKDALSRHLGEAVEIWMTGDELLNSKNEYLSNCITRITVQEGAVDRKLRERNKEIAEKEEIKRVKMFREQKENCWTSQMEVNLEDTVGAKRKDKEEMSNMRRQWRIKRPKGWKEERNWQRNPTTIAW